MMSEEDSGKGSAWFSRYTLLPKGYYDANNGSVLYRSPGPGIVHYSY